MSIQLNTGQAWTDATKMIGTNRDLVVVLTGIFFFIPTMVVMLGVLGTEFDFGDPGAEPNPEMITAQINAIITEYWWAMLIAALGQLAGAIAVLGLLGDPDKPTVRDVMAMIPKLILTMIGAQILATIATQILPYLAGLLPLGVQALLSLPLFILTIFLSIKLSLAGAVIVIEKERNPITSLKRSWQLTNGNTLRLFIFYLLLVIAGFVLALIAAITLNLIFSVFGERLQLIGNAVVLSALITGFYALSYAVTAAIHRQLSGPTNTQVAKTFD